MAAVFTPYSHDPNAYYPLGWQDQQGRFSRLAAYIRPFVEGFAVTDEASRLALSEMTGPRGVMNSVFLSSYFAQDIMGTDPTTFKNLLGLGMDLSNELILTALARNDRAYAFLSIMVKIRMDMDIPFKPRNVNGSRVLFTFRQVLTNKCFEANSNLWLQADSGTLLVPNVAQLACEGDFYAVFNLIRRDVVPFTELREKYNGMNVLDWARFYGQDCLAEELQFRYPFLAKESPGIMAADGNKGQKDTDIQRLQQMVDALKQELGQVKEYVGLCLEKVDKNVLGLEKKVEGKAKELKKEIEEKLEEMEDALSKEYLTRKGFKYYKDLIVQMRDRFNLSDSGDEQ